MALNYVPEPDTLLTCPYDNTHSIRAIRFPKHLVKCGKNSSIKLVTCPFNANHLYPEEKHSTHVAECCDRVFAERRLVSKYHHTVTGNVDVPNYDSHVQPSIENWDHELDASRKTYDPSEAIKKAYFRNPHFLSRMKPAEKKLFHKELLLNSRSMNTSYDIISDEVVVNVADDLQQLKIHRRRQPSPDIERPPSVASVLSSSSSLGFGRGRGFVTNVDNQSTNSVSRTGSSSVDLPLPRLMFSRGRGLNIYRNTEPAPSPTPSSLYATDTDTDRESVCSEVQNSTSSRYALQRKDKDWRFLCDTYRRSTKDNNNHTEKEVDHIREKLASVCLDKEYSGQCDPRLIQYVVERLSRISLKKKPDPTPFDSMPMQFIIDELKRIRLDVEMSAQHDCNLLQYIIDRLSNLTLENNKRSSNKHCDDSFPERYSNN